MQMEAIREALQEMKAGQEDLLRRLEDELAIYKSYDTMPLPEEVERKFTMTCRDMRIIIRRMDYMIRKVFVDDGEHTLAQKRAIFSDFKTDTDSKEKTFDELISMMSRFNRDHYSKLKRETEAENQRLADEEGDETVS